MRATHTIGLLAMLSMLAAPVTTAEAQQTPRARVAIQSAYDEGYREGLRVGSEHSRLGRPFNFGVAVEFRRGDAGYRLAFGTRDQYRADFRVGFERGYRSGYDQYAVRRPGPPSWSHGRGVATDPAFRNGFDDGYREGLNDGRRRHRNDPFAESRYRSGDHHFEKWYGSREAYRLNYREAFRDGYERGYADGWRR